MNFMKNLAIGASTLVMLFGGASAQATTIYATGLSDPFGNQTNDTAMDTAFGTGNWTKSYGFNMGLFSGANMVFLDGSEYSANQLSSFITANKTSIQDYVANGGHLFINSAPKQGGSFDMGFGVTLNASMDREFHTPYATITEAGIAAGLSAGGIVTNFSDGDFGLAAVSGPISNLIEGSAGTLFGAMNYGDGFVAFGGQTTANYHRPYADAKILLVNELRYVANTSAVAEPETYAMLLAGLAVMGSVARRKSGKKAG